MVFDLSAFQTTLPSNVRVFASGANRRAEIEGFNLLNIPVGVSVNHLNEEAISALIELQRPVMIDSGAFSEVSVRDGAPRTVRPINDGEWRRRLDVYKSLAFSLRENALLVAPDKVGDQQETLRRLKRFSVQLRDIATTGAGFLLPLQVGSMSHAEFYAASQSAADVPLIPAMTMCKATTSMTALVDFIQECKPKHVHLLGMGIRNRRAKKVIRLIRHYAPETSISMDSNRIRAVVGRSRRLTQHERMLQSTPIEVMFGEVESPVLVLSQTTVDYTDSIAFPSYWMNARAREAIGESVGLTGEDRQEFKDNPDVFLQTGLVGDDETTWIEHPVMAFHLDQAWQEYVESLVKKSVRSAAIAATFTEDAIAMRSS